MFTQVDWLDRLTISEIQKIKAKETKESDCIYLMIEFPAIIVENKIYSIVYYEPDGDEKYTFISKPKLVTVPDSEVLQVKMVINY